MQKDGENWRPLPLLDSLPKLSLISQIIWASPTACWALPTGPLLSSAHKPPAWPDFGSSAQRATWRAPRCSQGPHSHFKVSESQLRFMGEKRGNVSSRIGEFPPVVWLQTSRYPGALKDLGLLQLLVLVD